MRITNACVIVCSPGRNLEDATPAENQEAFKLIRQHTTTALAAGEALIIVCDCKDLIANQLIGYIRTSVVNAGGITHLRRIADYASLYQVRTGWHGATDLWPVCMGAALRDWISTACRFPNSMVDRIVPRTTDADPALRRRLQALLRDKVAPTLPASPGLDLQQRSDALPAGPPIRRRRDGRQTPVEALD